MTTDGKIMSVTRRDVRALEHACGGDVEDDARPWNIGAIWLAMTYSTVYRWRSGYNEEIASNKKVEAMRRTERRAAYGTADVRTALR